MLYQADKDLEVFVQSLPKTEMHLHIEGACPFELLQEMDPEKYAESPVFWDNDYRFESFNHFMDLYIQYSGEFFNSAQRYHDAAKIVLRRCYDQNVKYVETSFHGGVITFIKESGPEVIAAIKSAAPEGLEVRVFMGVCHNDYKDALKEVIDDSIGWEGLAGLDLHGWEDMELEPWTGEIWQRAREAGKFNKAHAGEFMGPDFICQVLDELKVTRIEHGVRSVEDPALVERLVREGIALDICPISNLKLQVVPSMDQHPIRRLFDAGVIVTVNSDDPFFFGNSLSEEYYAITEELNFTRPELVRLAKNGFELALWDAASKQDYLDRLDEIAGVL
ncbi:MAG: adenosine deaminase [Candidatus Auribacterota bacterium]|nr:adenosine deaminase [Candidatus Auribacterota bacterium]